MGQVCPIPIATAATVKQKRWCLILYGEAEHVLTPVAPQTMSFGLTQYDMEELMTFTNNQCALMPLTGPLKLDRGRVRLDVLRSVRS